MHYNMLCYVMLWHGMSYKGRALAFLPSQTVRPPLWSSLLALSWRRLLFGERLALSPLHQDRLSSVRVLLMMRVCRPAPPNPVAMSAVCFLPLWLVVRGFAQRSRILVLVGATRRTAPRLLTLERDTPIISRRRRNCSVSKHDSLRRKKLRPRPSASPRPLAAVWATPSTERLRT